MWYAASLFMKGIHIVDPPIKPLWEESIVLIEAPDDLRATEKAGEIGRSKEHSYYVDKPSRHEMRWEFIQVERVYEIDSSTFSAGLELFSRFLRDSEAESLLTPFDDDKDVTL
ncbi:DUF4288 domain-containing protein [Nitrospira sp. BLG_1]|uniref:DUF4288 domain-containing protein n=1 Tax=Nitrospira sp. BLG_1 TaxID=3395883 RepID=UPI0039BCDE79